MYVDGCVQGDEMQLRAEVPSTNISIVLMPSRSEPAALMATLVEGPILDVGVWLARSVPIELKTTKLFDPAVGSLPVLPDVSVAIE